MDERAALDRVLKPSPPGEGNVDQRAALDRVLKPSPPGEGNVESAPRASRVLKPSPPGEGGSDERVHAVVRVGEGKASHDRVDDAGRVNPTIDAVLEALDESRSRLPLTCRLAR